MDEKNFKLAQKLRHELHRHPELSNEEHWTKGRLMAFLKENTGLEIVDRGRWFYAVYRGKNPKKNVAFRADFDAVPIEDEIEKDYRSEISHVGHKCGHDGHAASLAALALEVDQGGADHNIYFIFQHAEEVGEGAKCCAQVIDECSIDEIYAFHNMSGFPWGTVILKSGSLWCASKGMEIDFVGTPTHASIPEAGKNPAFAIAKIVDEIPKLIDPVQYEGLVLCTVIQIDVGERAFGCSASKGKLLLTIRGQYEQEMNRLQGHLEQLAKEEAIRYGLTCRCSFYDVFPETVNDPECVDRIRGVCKQLQIPVIEVEHPMRSSEDFGYFLKRTKGAMFFLGNGEHYPPIHTAEYDFIDEEIKIAVEILKHLAK